MKRFLSIFVIIVFSVISASAQWKLKYAENEYTETKIPQLIYDTTKPVGFVRYIEKTLEVYFFYISQDNFDLWWEATMNDNGWINYSTDLDINFIGNSPQEFNLSTTISNNEKDKLYFSFAIDDENEILLNAMKANRTMKIRFYDIVKEKTRIISLPLNGVTLLCKKGKL